jgi:hypothetical protein
VALYSEYTRALTFENAAAAHMNNAFGERQARLAHSKGDDVTYVYDDVTYVYDDVTYGRHG